VAVEGGEALRAAAPPPSPPHKVVYRAYCDKEFRVEEAGAELRSSRFFKPKFL